MLVRDKAEDQVPTRAPRWSAVGRALGYPPGFDPGQVVDDYRRAARRARRVVERIFYAPSAEPGLSGRRRRSPAPEGDRIRAIGVARTRW